MINVNKEHLVENMQEVSLISQRQIFNHMKSNSTEPHTIKVIKEFRRLLHTIKQLFKDADQLAKEVKEKQDFNLLTKSNSFRLTAKKKQSEAETLDGTLKLVTEKKKAV